MEPDFWHERWDKDQIGFHQTEINPYLCKYFSVLHAPEHSEILVPLCGKSRDLLWLSEQGHPVTGVEINQKAVRAFFAENRISFEQRNLKDFILFEGGIAKIYCGDFFAFRTTVNRRWRYCYDRASLIALPPSMRGAYAREIAALLEPGAQSLLITLEYDQSEMNGPPFSVLEREVREHFEADFTVRRLETANVLGENLRFKEKGLTGLLEVSYHLTRIAATKN